MKKVTKPKNQKQPLEEEILKKVYKYEAKRTYKMILFLWIGFFLVQFFVIITTSALYHTLKEQQTLDLFQLMWEDFEIIKENFADVLYTFSVEAPLGLLFSFLLLLSIIFGIIIFVFKNYKKIKNRIASINTFFLKKN